MKTVTWVVPETARSAAGMAACNLVLFTKSVCRPEPFQRTIEDGMKPLPPIVRTRSSPPAGALFGEIEATEGVGFAPLLLMVKGTAFEVPPPGAGLNTVTCAVPALAMSGARMEACNCVLLTNTVLRLLSFQRTSDPAT